MGPIKVSAVLFDFYNTLVSIVTDEGDPDVRQGLTRFLAYHSLHADADWLRGRFFTAADQMQHRLSAVEAYPETDVFGIFRSQLAELAGSRDRRPDAEVDALAGTVVRLFRTLSMRHFKLFPDTLAALDALRGAG